MEEEEEPTTDSGEQQPEPEEEDQQEPTTSAGASRSDLSELSPPKDQEFMKAKAFLMTSSTDSGQNVYDHLSMFITNVLEENPEDIVEVFEDVSYTLKKSQYRPDSQEIQDEFEKSSEVELARIQKRLFDKPLEDDDMHEDEPETPLPNLLEMCFYFEQSGFGLNRGEMIRVWLAMKRLVATYSLQSIRFWGKILGLEYNYYVTEVEFRYSDEDEFEDDYETTEEEETPDKEEVEEEEEEEEEKEEEIFPKSEYKPPPIVPKEEKGVGVNKKTYFVCSDPGKTWIKLPQLKPVHITGARQIRKFLTGRLDAPVLAYPPFQGNEANYLRAQIARISAGTHISPIGYYMFDEEEEEEEDGERRECVVNPEYEGVPVRELADPALASWVRHVLHILPQGRCTWWNPSQKNEDDAEDEEDDEDREEPEEPEPETGPSLLTPLSEDEEVAGMPTWTANLSSNLIPQYAIAVMRSNIWPGAYAFGTEKKFENIYVGSGLKYSQDSYSPMAPPAILEEFPTGADVTEIEDPTPEEEAALKAAELEAAEAGDDDEDDEDEDDDD